MAHKSAASIFFCEIEQKCRTNSHDWRWAKRTRRTIGKYFHISIVERTKTKIKLGKEKLFRNYRAWPTKLGLKKKKVENRKKTRQTGPGNQNERPGKHEVGQVKQNIENKKKTR